MSRGAAVRIAFSTITADNWLKSIISVDVISRGQYLILSAEMFNLGRPPRRRITLHFSAGKPNAGKHQLTTFARSTVAADDVGARSDSSDFPQEDIAEAESAGDERSRRLRYTALALRSSPRGASRGPGSGISGLERGDPTGAEGKNIDRAQACARTTLSSSSRPASARASRRPVAPRTHVAVAIKSNARCV